MAVVFIVTERRSESYGVDYGNGSMVMGVFVMVVKGMEGFIRGNGKDMVAMVMDLTVRESVVILWLWKS